MNLVPEFDPLYFSEAALRMRSYRQQILSSNMANVDTPGYKARDVLFSQALREQLEGTAYSNALPLASSNERHYRIGGSLPGAPALLYRMPMQPSLDGNTVDVETERSHFADNALRTEAAMTMLSSVISSRRMALSGNNS
jgi:flagellar basal-body rod protein FlgB